MSGIKLDVLDFDEIGRCPRLLIQDDCSFANNSRDELLVDILAHYGHGSGTTVFTTLDRMPFYENIPVAGLEITSYTEYRNKIITGIYSAQCSKITHQKQCFSATAETPTGQAILIFETLAMYEAFAASKISKDIMANNKRLDIIIIVIANEVIPEAVNIFNAVFIPANKHWLTFYGLENMSIDLDLEKNNSKKIEYLARLNLASGAKLCYHSSTSDFIITGDVDDVGSEIEPAPPLENPSSNIDVSAGYAGYISSAFWKLFGY